MQNIRGPRVHWHCGTVAQKKPGKSLAERNKSIIYFCLTELSIQARVTVRMKTHLSWNAVQSTSHIASVGKIKINYTGS